ncbi:SRPBCC family protein [Pontixanthobacter aquaemixtae]|uniref:Polyketide cyclase / dehydrase and lipid transport n=1 Tax=Pontixanthobacter aquaemixtae TaxID=1958940 RepID=A0A844ZV05_9SPHN|nr:SRPBCC domain-containing protein [Pontixanthobacter aquaemixtae]MXO91705.1 hypothetical protein [Pontixanthobacter aquaemixtae]
MNIRSTIRSLSAAALLLLGASASAQPDSAPPEGNAAVTTEIIEENDGTLTLVHETVIAAPVAEVWKTLSTAEGWAMWGPSFAKFDLRQGGSIETGYHKNAAVGDERNIRHRILAFVPERIMAIRVEYAPPGPIDPALVTKLWGVYELEPGGNGHTSLRISGLGYGTDEASTKLLEFFEQGNVWSIETMRKNLEAQMGAHAGSPPKEGE